MIETLACGPSLLAPALFAGAIAIFLICIGLCIYCNKLLVEAAEMLRQSQRRDAIWWKPKEH